MHAIIFGWNTDFAFVAKTFARKQKEKGIWSHNYHEKKRKKKTEENVIEPNERVKGEIWRLFFFVSDANFSFALVILVIFIALKIDGVSKIGTWTYQQ